MSRTARIALVVSLAAAFAVMPSAEAIHWYRGTGSSCSAADGALTDDPLDENGIPVHGPRASTVELWHDSYHDSSISVPGAGGSTALMPAVTRIQVGQSVSWTWNSAHCHSVTFTGLGFGSGLHYPQTVPSSPRVVPNFFDYPVLETAPTLSYTKTFDQAGTFRYVCDHHGIIGMQGVVIVE